MDHSAHAGFHFSAVDVLESADVIEEEVSHVAALSAPSDLMAAHLATHALSGTLLELSKASIGLTVGDGAPIGDGTAEVWTATLRSDVDGPGGVYALIAPASLVWKMPSRALSDHPTPQDPEAIARMVFDALATVAARMPIAVRMSKEQILVLTVPVVVAVSGDRIRLGAGRPAKAPLAMRLA